MDRGEWITLGFHLLLGLIGFLLFLGAVYPNGFEAQSNSPSTQIYP